MNATVSGNVADDRVGAGISNDEGTIILSSSTITGNGYEEDYGESGIRNVAGTVLVNNTIIAGNLAPASPDCSGQITSSGYNLIGNGAGCDILQDDANHNDLVDPLLGPLQDNGGATFTHALLSGSPAIDEGNNESCAATDQWGITRPQGAACDIGAFEVSPLEPRKVVVFLKGIGSDLTLKEINTIKESCNDPFYGDSVFGAIKSALRGMNFECDNFLHYSYAGDSVDDGVKREWHPNPYTCENSGQNLTGSIEQLRSMLRDYRREQAEIGKNVQFVLIGHSLGGVIALETTGFIGEDPG